MRRPIRIAETSTRFFRVSSFILNALRTFQGRAQASVYAIIGVRRNSTCNTLSGRKDVTMRIKNHASILLFWPIKVVCFYVLPRFLVAWTRKCALTWQAFYNVRSKEICHKERRCRRDDRCRVTYAYTSACLYIYIYIPSRKSSRSQKSAMQSSPSPNEMRARKNTWDI